MELQPIQHNSAIPQSQAALGDSIYGYRYPWRISLSSKLLTTYHGLERNKG
jgi:hypothetical protein